MMWSVWTKAQIQQNKRSSISIVLACLITSFFMGLLCLFAYNMWTDQIHRKAETIGDWHLKITKSLSDEELARLENFAGIEKIETPEEAGLPANSVLSEQLVYAENPREAYTIKQNLMESFSLQEDEITSNALYLSDMFIQDPNDPSPPLLLSFFALMLICACISLILVLRHVFALTMSSQIRSLGLLAVNGATPAQIRKALIQQGMVLAVIPCILGCLAAIPACRLLMQSMENLAGSIASREASRFSVSFGVILICLACMFACIWFSLWLPARKISKMALIEALNNPEGLYLKKEKRRGLLARMFGVPGELAAVSLKARRSKMRLGSIALFTGFSCFCIMLSFLALSQISTNHTYFERFADRWDIQLDIKEGTVLPVSDAELKSQLESLDHIQDTLLYRMVDLQVQIPDSAQSDTLIESGGLGSMNKGLSSTNNWRMGAQVFILDDQSFESFMKENNLGSFANASGILDSASFKDVSDGASTPPEILILNQIWDSAHSPSLDKVYIPLLKDSNAMQVCLADESACVESEPVLIESLPELKESADPSGANLVISQSGWQTLKQQLGSTHAPMESQVHIRLLTDEPESAEVLAMSEQASVALLEKNGIEYTSLNRVQEKIDNDRIYSMYSMVIGFFTSLIGIIGLAAIAFHVLSSISLRRREMALYISMGMDLGQIRSMLALETLALAAKPVGWGLLIFAGGSTFLAILSYVDLTEFWSQAPIMPVMVYVLMILLVLGLCCWYSLNQIEKIHSAEVLKDDRL